MFFEVIPTAVFRQNGTVLTYSSDRDLPPGQLVLIPLGSRTIIGIVSRRVPHVDFPTKPISSILPLPPLPAHLLKALFWLSQYYLAPLSSVANLILPSGLTARGALKPTTSEISSTSTSKKPQTMVSSTSTSAGSHKGVSSRTAKKPASRAKTSPAAIQGPLSANSLKLPLIELNSAQQNALRALSEAPGATRLLRGVTGSGKTNIYLKLAAEALSAQKSTILLVPEIALTSQLVRIFQNTFGARITLMHSGQTPKQRRDIWLKLLQATRPGIIIGPRSALFAPLHDLGLIIIDEAHEGAYYQENAPRYSTLRLASFMAQAGHFPCIQGSATPNIVDYYLAKQHHSLVELTAKAKHTALTPTTEVIDLTDRSKFNRNRYFADSLLTKITNNLQAKHQTLIFHNRRGSAPLTICEECGWQALCPACFLPLTLHADSYTLNCHLCGYETKVPSSCPNCAHAGIIHKGFGTKLLESELKQLFPEAKIARFDGDNKKSTSLADLYQSVKTGQIDLLIGTQTLARGLDLPHLATVGIVQADAGLALPDFAAEERCFELITQVIGRVGRGHLDRAEVVVQTYQPEHPVIQSALRADFGEFSRYLLQKRRQQQLPPFTYLARLAITYKTEKTTLAKIRQAHQALSLNPHLTISPPLPAFHERTARGFTWQLTLKSTSRQALVAALLPYAQYHIEIDPPSLL